MGTQAWREGRQNQKTLGLLSMWLVELLEWDISEDLVLL